MEGARRERKNRERIYTDSGVRERERESEVNRQPETERKRLNSTGRRGLGRTKPS